MTQVVVHHTPRDVVWHGVKLGFGIAIGSIWAVVLLIYGVKLLAWVGA